PPTTPYRSAGAVPTVRERSCLSAAWGSPPRCRRLGSTPAWDGDRYVASPASGFARRVRRRSGRSVRLRPVLGSLLPGPHPTTSTTTHPSPTASPTVQTRQNQGWPSCGSSQSRSPASEHHTVASTSQDPATIRPSYTTRWDSPSAPNFTRPYRRKTTVLLAVALLASLLWTPRPVLAADSGDSSFLDLTSDSGQAHVFATEVEWLASRGITRGCNPPDDNLFCVDEVVTRGQMAAFLNRALRLPEGSKVFADTAGHLFEDDIAALGTAGITRGCNPPDNTLFCPDDPVTRGQMAAFLTRALDLAAGTEVFA